MKHFVCAKNKVKHYIPLILLLCAVAAFYLTFGCPLRWLFGICCPSCGMSRAVEALLRFDFLLAFQMHPLVFILPFAVIIYMFRKKLPRKVIVFLSIAALILMLAVYFYRLANGSDIVYADFERGVLYKMLQNFTVEG
ncbi:MAG: DUF2752 domain-containing protein [Ruminococcaceae bacterium]|nr:DUF2752 domain-containing protein [Oscillospiraceae bacterium]